eukprot:763138-Hanusia_phi.AAC.8
MEIERVLGRVEKKAEKLSSDSRKKLCEKILECTKSFFQPQSVMEVKDSGGFKEEVEMKDDSCMMETTPEKFPRRRVDAKTSQPAKSATKRRTTSLACTSEPIPAFHLQAEQLLCIFRFLSHQDLRKSLLVCKLWNTAACDDRLWSWMYSKADFKMPEVMPTSWRKEFLRVEQRHQRWASGTCRKKRLAGHRAAVNCMSVEGNLLVTGSDDHDLRVWNLLEKDATSVRLHGHKGKVVCCCIVDKLVASGSEDCLVILWNISNGKAKMRFRQHLQPVTCLATDKKRLVFSGSVDMQVCIWCTSSLSNIAVLRDHRLAVFCLSFISPLQLLVSGGKESEVRVWRLRDKNKPAIILRGHSASVTSLDTTDSLIASGSDDRSVRLWDAFTGPVSLLITRADSSVSRIVLEIISRPWGPRVCVEVDRKSSLHRKVRVEESDLCLHDQLDVSALMGKFGCLTFCREDATRS